MSYTHKIGATFDLTGRLRLAGAAQDMSGWGVRAAMRSGARQIDLVCEWLDPAQGVLRMHTAADQQADWQAGRYAIDVRLTRPDGVVLISRSGEIVLAKAVTP